jgi:hypothetical protein
LIVKSTKPANRFKIDIDFPVDKSLSAAKKSDSTDWFTLPQLNVIQSAANDFAEV